MLDKIRDLILHSIQGATVYVENPMNDDVHFQCIVISDLFESMSLVQQHKRVLQSLKVEFDNNVVHALVVKTYTPKQWASQVGDSMYA